MRTLLLWLLQFYKQRLSPLMPPACRFEPTCSVYAYEVVSRFGVLRGGALALFRILRCQPLCRGGFDPAPLTFPSLFQTIRPRNRS